MISKHYWSKNVTVNRLTRSTQHNLHFCSRFIISIPIGPNPRRTCSRFVEKASAETARRRVQAKAAEIITLLLEFLFDDRHWSHELLSSGVSREFKRPWKRPIDKPRLRKSVAYTVNTTPPLYNPRGIPKYARVYTRAPLYTPAPQSSW